MKATEIKITIEKVDPKYNDKIWIGVTFQVQDGDELENSILDARAKLNKAYEAMKEPKVDTIKLLLNYSDDKNSFFQMCCDSLKAKRTTIEELEENYNISAPALNHLKKLVE